MEQQKIKLPGFRSEISNFSSSDSFLVGKKQNGSSGIKSLILPVLALLFLNFLAIWLNRENLGWVNRFLAGGLSEKSQVLGTVSAPSPVETERGFLTGRVMDWENGIPIDNALVYVFENENFIPKGRAKSSVNGSFEIALPPGVYKVTVSKLGYENQFQIVKVISSERTEIDFYLESYWLVGNRR